MIKKSLILSFLLIVTISGFSQDNSVESEKTKSDIPEKIVISLDGLLKTRTSNSIFNLKIIDNYFYVLQKSVFVNVLFSADLDEKIKKLEKNLKEKFDAKKLKYDTYIVEMEKRTAAENKKIEEKNKKIRDSKKKIPLKVFVKPEAPVYKKRSSYHNLYLRVVRDGEQIQQFKSDVPYDEKGEQEYFSFGLILEPGKYDLLIAVDSFDNSEDGTLLAEIEVPKLTLMDITTPGKSLGTSRPVFYRSVNTLLESEKRFTVVRNACQIGIMKQKFSPYTGTEFKFKSGDSPILAFFLKGAKMLQKNPPWDLTGNISIIKGKKKVSVFKPVKLQNPYFFQPIPLSGKDKKELPEGDYILMIELNDNNSKGLKGKVTIPFSIVK